MCVGGGTCECVCLRTSVIVTLASKGLICRSVIKCYNINVDILCDSKVFFFIRPW